MGIFCATSERHTSHNTFMSKEPIFKFSNDNHSQLTILKYQQLLTNVFQRSFHKAQILHLEKNKEKTVLKYGSATSIMTQTLSHHEAN